MKIYYHVVAARDERNKMFHVRLASRNFDPDWAEDFVKEKHMVSQAVCINVYSYGEDEYEGRRDY